MEIIIVLGAFIALALAAWRWGVDSTDGIDSAEWEHRRAWQSDSRRPRW